jgi:hypothetical protein
MINKGNFHWILTIAMLSITFSLRSSFQRERSVQNHKQNYIRTRIFLSTCLNTQLKIWVLNCKVCQTPSRIWRADNCFVKAILICWNSYSNSASLSLRKHHHNTSHNISRKLLRLSGSLLINTSIKLDKTNEENFLCTCNLFLPVSMKFVENTQARLMLSTDSYVYTGN